MICICIYIWKIIFFFLIRFCWRNHILSESRITYIKGLTRIIDEKICVICVIRLIRDSDEKIREYILNIIFMTRDQLGSGAKDLHPLIECGASPRATIALHKAAKAFAFLRGRGYVTPDDVKQIAPDVLRHRILVTFEAQAEDITSDQVIERILSLVAVP